MNTIRDYQPLNTRLDHFASESARLFGWTPSKHFLGAVATFARSVGQSNFDDFFSLLACEASEWYSLRRQGQFFRSAFLTAWGLNLIRKVFSARSREGTVTLVAAKVEVQRLSESNLATVFCRHLEENPQRYNTRTYMSPAEILWEDSVLRSLDRERQRWRREARRLKTELREDDRKLSYLDDPISRLVAAETIQRINEFVETSLDDEDRALFRGRFEQGLSYDQLASILGMGPHGIPALRQRMKRMREKVCAAVAITIK